MQLRQIYSFLLFFFLYSLVPRFQFSFVRICFGVTRLQLHISLGKLSLVFHHHCYLSTLRIFGLRS